VVSTFPKQSLTLCAPTGLNQCLRCLPGERCQYFPPFDSMFTGLWLRICFGFGRHQQFIAPPMSNVQFVPTPLHDYRHSYVTFFSLSYCNSLFSRYLSECAQFQSFPSSRSELGIGQVLLRQGNSQYRYTTHIRTSIRQTIVGVRTLVRSGAGPITIVRCFASPRHLIPNITLFQRRLDHDPSALCHVNRDLRSGRSPTVTHRYFIRNAREGRRRSAYVASEILALTPASPLALTNVTSS
jgi:hypothetical protein